MEKRLTEQSIRYLEEGNIDAAQDILDKLVAKYPYNPDAYHLLAVISLQNENYDHAYDLVSHAINLNSSTSIFYNTLGNIEIYRGHVIAAEEAFINAVINEPEQLEYRYNLANFYFSQSDFQQAIAQYQHLLKQHPEHYLAKRGLTLANYFSGNIDETLRLATEWSKDYSNVDEPYYYKGLCLHATNQLSAALQEFDKGLLLNPTNAEIMRSIGTCYRALGNFQLAENYLRKALTIDSNNPQALFNLGCIYLENNDLISAKDYLQKAHNLDKMYPEPLLGMGCIQQARGDDHKALEFFNEALRLDKNNIDTKILLANTYLKLYDFNIGWEYYSERYKHYTYNNNLTKKIKDICKVIPKWDGNPLNSKETLFLWSEQGIGDIIMFASILPEVIKLVPNIVMQCEPRLIPLLRRSFPSIDYSADIELRSNIYLKRQLPLAELGRLFRQDQSLFQQPESFLVPDHQQTNYFFEKYKQLFADKKLVGIAWRTNNKQTGHLRSLCLNTFLDFIAELFDDIIPNDDIQLINLQYGHNPLPDFIYQDDEVDPLQDLDIYAAQIASLDHVITIDNNTAHFAGGLGIPTQVLIPQRSDWRWGKDQEQAIWYPSVKILQFD